MSINFYSLEQNEITTTNYFLNNLNFNKIANDKLTEDTAREYFGEIQLFEEFYSLFELLKSVFDKQGFTKNSLNFSGRTNQNRMNVIAHIMPYESSQDSGVCVGFHTKRLCDYTKIPTADFLDFLNKLSSSKNHIPSDMTNDDWTAIYLKEAEVAKFSKAMGSRLWGQVAFCVIL